MLDTHHIDDQTVQQLKTDNRLGVQKLIKAYEKRIEQEIILAQNFKKMSAYEQQIYDKGFNYIAGVDEVGRGPLAGPVVSAAVILPKDFKLLGLTDSKLLSEKKRHHFFKCITSEAISYRVSVIDNQRIDEINIFQATKEAMRDCISKLSPAPDFVLIDAVKLESLPCDSESIIKGDLKSISIAAASIIAKVTRDQMMKELHLKYPMYQFDANMGYGTKHHIEMLKQYGPTPYHRKTFAPVRNQM